ncbi:MAG: NADH-dependent [FeFe] hydrogenase, group A6 [Bacillota bacterium]
MINIKINGLNYKAELGETILEVARRGDIYIPTLCHMNLHDFKVINKAASCRVCMVEVEGRKNLAPACSTNVTEGMIINTDTLRAVKARRVMVELLLSNHPKDCLICDRNQNCELQKLAADVGVREIKYQGEMSSHPRDCSSLSLVRNAEKCVLCRRCETMCNEVQTVGVYSAVDRGFDTVIGTAFNLPMKDTACTFCGQCVSVCPTGALTEVDNTRRVLEILQTPGKIVIAQTAPAIRVALGEEFDMPVGTRVTGKMVSALRKLGFDKVMDTDFAADVTIMEEASEIIHRLEHGGRLPILTSCCPAWVKFIEHQFPDLLDIPSTCKSPHEMFGALAKTYLAEKMGAKPEDIVVISVMPCLAKKYEAARPELSEESMQNVDFVISTRELARMIKQAGINFATLPDDDFDHPMGESSGAGVIFGATGGVIEAALRTAYEWLTKEPLMKISFTQLRGFEGVRESSVMVNGTELKIAIAHGLGNARRLLESIRDGKAFYHAIEIMACPGGCIGGGGQPYHHGDTEIIMKRAAAIYAEDESKTIRFSHKNPSVIKLYKDFLGEPYGEKAHELLHTTYTKRTKI